MNALAFDQSKAAATSQAVEWQLDAARNPEPFTDNATYRPVMGVSWVFFPFPQKLRFFAKTSSNLDIGCKQSYTILEYARLCSW